ncbi:MAG: hypothetical protein ABSG67_22380 [Thermoguttaceae bacterium]
MKIEQQDIFPHDLRQIRQPEIQTPLASIQPADADDFGDAICSCLQ